MIDERERRIRFTTIAHAQHRFLSPIGEERVAWLLGELACAGLPERADVIDVGCGKAELALQIAKRFRARVTAVDPNAAFLTVAAERALTLGVPNHVRLVRATADEAGVERGAFDLACCIGATHAFGGLERTIGGLRELARPRALLLIGECLWRRAPTAEFLSILGATERDHRSHADNREFLAARGLSLRTSWESSLEEWDSYENLYASTMLAHLDAHPNDPDHDAFRARITAWQGAYRRHGRETLGFGWYLCQT